MRGGLHVVKQVTKTEKTMAGSKRRKPRRRAARKVASPRRRRSVGGSGKGTGLMIAVGLGAIALLLLTQKPATPTGTYQGQPLPPLQPTGNYTRDSKSQELLSYAAAAGLAVDAIIKLIDRLNTSTDNEVDNIYDHVNTTGDVGNWV